VTAGRRNGVIGALLYAVTVLLLVAGTLWWLRAAPVVGTDPQIIAWRLAVERLLPDRQEQIMARTVVVRTAGSSRVDAQTRPGRHFLFFLCAGQGQVLLRLSPTGPDSGRLVSCNDRPRLESLVVGVADRFTMRIEGLSPTTVVFRWQLVVASR
jgi:hypothetical protein